MTALPASWRAPSAKRTWKEIEELSLLKETAPSRTFSLLFPKVPTFPQTLQTEADSGGAWHIIMLLWEKAHKVPHKETRTPRHKEHPSGTIYHQGTSPVRAIMGIQWLEPRLCCENIPTTEWFSALSDGLLRFFILFIYYITLFIFWCQNNDRLLMAVASVVMITATRCKNFVATSWNCHQFSK